MIAQAVAAMGLLLLQMFGLGTLALAMMNRIHPR